MSRYIDADKAKEKLGAVRGAYCCFLEEDRPYYDVLSETIKMINEMSTADVVEVVRCEQCRHFDAINNDDHGWCKLISDLPIELSVRYHDDFCSFGER